MGVVVNVFLAVTEISITPGTVAEFQRRMGHICPAAHTATVGVGGCLLFRPLNDNGSAGLDMGTSRSVLYKRE